jgi:hypothetical protein
MRSQPHAQPAALPSSLETVSRGPQSDRLRLAWQVETSSARAVEARRDYRAAWAHLEYAHILSQPRAALHVRTHLAMLGFAARRRDAHELVGQLVRVVLAPIASWSRHYPEGNTGGADVGLFTPMPIPNPLRRVLNDTTDPKEHR